MSQSLSSWEFMSSPRWVQSDGLVDAAGRQHPHFHTGGLEHDRGFQETGSKTFLQEPMD
jgi:hypothetical protein